MTVAAEYLRNSQQNALGRRELIQLPEEMRSVCFGIGQQPFEHYVQLASDQRTVIQQYTLRKEGIVKPSAVLPEPITVRD